MLRRFDSWLAEHRVWTAVATAACFPVAVVSTGVTVGSATQGAWLLTAPALVVAVGSLAVVGLGIRHATRPRSP